jgi:hypothetical protein
LIDTSSKITNKTTCHVVAGEGFEPPTLGL